jgi:hypothetical protein
VDLLEVAEFGDGVECLHLEESQRNDQDACGNLEYGELGEHTEQPLIWSRFLIAAAQWCEFMVRQRVDDLKAFRKVEGGSTNIIAENLNVK